MARGPNVIEELRDIQRLYGYITDEGLHELSVKLKLPLHELHGVASYYPEFHLKKPPRVTIDVCTALPCQMRNGEGLLRALQKRAEGKADVDVRRCPCLGACDTTPAATVNGHLQICRSTEDLKELLLNAVAAIEGTRQPEPAHPIGIRGKFRIDPYEDSNEHYGALKALIVSGAYADVLKTIGEADLRGMGGAGKPASRKWEQVFKEKSDEKYVVCNADESEPGTLKDREILRNLPHVLVEAMIIGGLTVGATQGYIYLRHEYKAQHNALEDEISRVRKRLFNGKPLLGDDVGGSGRAFDLKVFTSPGGYIMGESTALLEALEGKRGQPRNQLVDVGMRKGVPSFNGLWGKPTLLNNVETWSYIPCILHKGPQWFLAQGVNGKKGLKWLSVCGDVNAPGVFEVPMGTTYRDVIDRAGGVVGGADQLLAFAPSGPTYGFRPAGDIDQPIDFCDPPGLACGSGAIIVLDKTRCMIDAALNFTRFFRNESCGKCVPCRVGSQKMVDLIKDIRAGKSAAGDVERYETDIKRLEDVLIRMSICGLGQVVPVPIMTVLKYWPNEIEAHLVQKQCAVGVCFAAKETVA